MEMKRMIHELIHLSAICKKHWFFCRGLFQWDLVCEREYLAGITQTLYMTGQVVGGVSSGILADRYLCITIVLISVLHHIHKKHLAID